MKSNFTCRDGRVFLSRVLLFSFVAGGWRNTRFVERGVCGREGLCVRVVLVCCFCGKNWSAKVEVEVSIQFSSKQRMDRVENINLLLDFGLV